MSVRVLLVVEDPLLRSLLAEKLSLEKDLQIVGAVGDPESCLEAVVVTQPAVVVLDLQWGGGIGLALLERLTNRAPDVATLALATDESEEAQLEAAQSGAKGVVTKTEGIATLPQAVCAVGRGEVWFTRSMSRRIFQEYHRIFCQKRETEHPLACLSPREREVLARVAEGMTHQDIADRLHMSIHTVKLHIQRILHKLGLPNRTEAAVFAVREGLVSPLPRRLNEKAA